MILCNLLRARSIELADRDIECSRPSRLKSIADPTGTVSFTSILYFMTPILKSGLVYIFTARVKSLIASTIDVNHGTAFPPLLPFEFEVLPDSSSRNT